MAEKHDFRPETEQKKARIRLPFERKKGDIGAWSFDHRAGICVTLIAYLLAGIIFVSSKISLGARTQSAYILVEIPFEDLQPQPEPEPREAEPLSEDFSDIRNLTSNENAELNTELRDDRGTNVSELYDNADALGNKMQANRELYEQGLRQEREMIEAARRGSEAGEQRQDTQVAGRVTVSYSFTDPTRTGVDMKVPAYQCEGGGQVVVNVTLNNNGQVTSASVDRSFSSRDDCMQRTALNAARGSRFNVDNNAPSRHQGTITYLFIPQ